ncbi:hypothetical protein THRCLA_22902, partial [Thraustotheca clavata]
EDDEDETLIFDMFFNSDRHKHSGGIVGRRIIKRNISLGHENLLRDYLGSSPVYNEKAFRRRFRRSSNRFRRIDRDLKNVAYFQQRRDGAGRLGASPKQKIAFAIRMLANGTPSDAGDEYIRLSDTVGGNSIRTM